MQASVSSGGGGRALIFILGLCFIAGLGLQPARADNTMCNIDPVNVNFGNINSILSDDTALSPTIKMNCKAFDNVLVGYCLELSPVNAADANNGPAGHRVLWTTLPGKGAAYLPFNFLTAENKDWGSPDSGNYGVPISGILARDGNGRAYNIPFTVKIGGGTGMQIAAGHYSNSFYVNLYYRIMSDSDLVPSELCGNTDIGTVLQPGKITVSADAQPACTVQVTQAVDFGANYRLDAVPPARGEIRVACGGGTKYTIGLNAGLHSDDGKQRAMQCSDPAKCSQAKIQYNLYQDQQHTIVWGNDKDINTVSGGFLYTDTGSRIYPVYAAIAPGQSSVSAGPYKDTVIITVWAEPRFPD